MCCEAGAARGRENVKRKLLLKNDVKRWKRLKRKKKEHQR
jgi:hypothetical protein